MLLFCNSETRRRIHQSKGATGGKISISEGMFFVFFFFFLNMFSLFKKEKRIRIYVNFWLYHKIQWFSYCNFCVIIKHPWSTFHCAQKQSDLLLNADDLDAMWVCLRENCVIDDATGAEKVSSQNEFLPWEWSQKELPTAVVDMPCIYILYSALVIILLGRSARWFSFLFFPPPPFFGCVKVNHLCHRCTY